MIDGSAGLEELTVSFPLTPYAGHFLVRPGASGPAGAAGAPLWPRRAACPGLHQTGFTASTESRSHAWGGLETRAIPLSPPAPRRSKGSTAST
jgi:hypothetical protein